MRRFGLRSPPPPCRRASLTTPVFRRAMAWSASLAARGRIARRPARTTSRALMGAARSRRAMREKRGLRVGRKDPSRASSSKTPLPLRYRAAEIQPLRAAMLRRRRRETPRTRLARERRPPSRSPVPGRSGRQDTESGIAGDPASPKLPAWVRFRCNVARAARRPPPPASRRRRQCVHEHCQRSAKRCPVFSPSCRRQDSVPLDAPWSDLLEAG